MSSCSLEQHHRNASSGSSRFGARLLPADMLFFACLEPANRTRTSPLVTDYRRTGFGDH